MKNKKQQIIGHMSNLCTIFGMGIEDDFLKTALYKELLRIEKSAHRHMENICNGSNLSEQQQEKIENKILSKIDDLLQFRSKKIPVFLNGDPRGHTIKINEKWLREKKTYIYQDMGGNGIMAPDFRRG